MSGKRLTEATMEVTTKGSFEHQESLSRPSTSHSVTSTSQLSLEYLPPEAPYFSMVDMESETADSSWEIEPQPRHHSHVEGEGDTEHWFQGAPQLQWGAVNECASEDTDELYHRIVELSDDIQQKLQESTGSYRKPRIGGVNSVGSDELSSNSATDTCVDRREGGRGEIGKDGGNNEEDELTVHKSRPEANRYVESAMPSSPRPSLPDTRGPTASSCNSRCSEKSDVHFEDAKTQKAYERMLKLDEKLDSVCQRERKVKHQRRLLEEEMERVGAGQPSSVLVSMGDGSHCISPVFPTQPNEIVPVQQSSSQVSETGLEGLHSQPTSQESPEAEGRKGARRMRDGGSKFETNFVKRNIELVADASSLVMMTKAEKQRLQELLEDDIEVVEIEGVEDTPNLALCPRINTNSAFGIADRDLERLRQLNSQLEAFRPGTRLWGDTSSAASTDFSSVILSPHLPAPGTTEEYVVPPAPSPATTEGGSTVPPAPSPATIEGGSTVPPAPSPATTEGGSTVQGVSVSLWPDTKERCESGSQQEVGVAMYQTGSVVESMTGDKEEEEGEEGEDSMNAELLRHLCIPHREMERLKVIDERLRHIYEENQSGFQGAVLDGQVLADLIQQSKAELLALAVPTTEEPGNSLTTPTGQAEQGEGQGILTTPTCTELGDSQESSELGDGATSLSMELGDSREGPHQVVTH